jgi:4'-phosphopantetheinyl transferase
VATIEQVLRTRDPHPQDTRAAHGMSALRSREYLAVRTLLRGLLAQVVAGAADLPIAMRGAGQPHLVSRPDLGISLAHTKDQLAVAVAVHHVVGVDTEAPTLVSRNVLRRCCTPSAFTMLDLLAPAGQALEFAWLWSVQEACVKAAGTGLAGRPWEIPVEPGQRAGRWRQFRWKALRDQFTIPVTCAYDDRSDRSLASP